MSRLNGCLEKNSSSSQMGVRQSFKMKQSVVYDWAVLPCDHLICIESFQKYSEELKTMFSCGCGAQFTQSAYEHLVTHCSSARDGAKHLK